MKIVTTAGATTHSRVTRTGRLHKWKKARLLKPSGDSNVIHVFPVMLMSMTEGIS